MGRLWCRIIEWVRFVRGTVMLIHTTRFGNVEINEKDIIKFPEGLLGFNDLRSFVLLDDPTDDIFAWLQSCDLAEVAFPVLEPDLFRSSYKANLGKRDLEALGMENMNRARTYCIVTIPDDPTQMTANLKAPVIINIPGRTARQCVLQDNDLAIRHNIFADLQKRVVSTPVSDIKKQNIESELAVRIPELTTDKTTTTQI